MLSLLPFFAIAQDHSNNALEKNVEAQADTMYNFLVHDSDLIWQKVFDSNLNTAQIAEYLSSVKELSVESVSENRIVAKGNVYQIPFMSKYNFGAMEVSTIVAHRVTYSVLVDIKSGKYRVTVNQIESITPIMGSIKSRLYTTFFSKKKGGIKASFKYSGLPLNVYFSDIFTVPEPVTDNW